MSYMVNDVRESVLRYARSQFPSEVSVVDGGELGIESNEMIAPPSIAIRLDEVEEAEIELGSDYYQFQVLCFITAASSLQRDALKSLTIKYLSNAALPIYSKTVEGIEYMSDHAVMKDFRMSDVPDFSDTRLYWSAVFVIKLIISGRL